MLTQWRFDTDNPYDDSFEEELLKVAHASGGLDAIVFDVVKRRLLDILKDPKSRDLFVIRGQLMYIAVAGAAANTGELKIEPLLIAYTLDERKKLIQRVFVARATDYIRNPKAGTITAMAPTLRDAIERAMTNAPKKGFN